MTPTADSGTCTCPWGERSLGKLYGIDMGRGIVRLSTTPGCPEHDSCHRYTAAFRAGKRNGRWLSCPIHGARNCPPPNDGSQA